MTGTQTITLIVVSALAGAINAIAGGGTLLTFPTLVFCGTPERIANATSTLALVLGTAGSIFGFRKQVTAIKPWLWRFIPVCLVGGWLGSLLFTKTSDTMFAKLVPFLILFATVLFLAQGAFRRVAGNRKAIDPNHASRGLWIAIGFQFAVAVYGGYFGAGIGILMLASLGFLGLENIHEMNALKNILGSLINFVAAVWFVINGLVDWEKAFVMLVGALAGYWLGAHFSQRIPQQRVRHLITVIGFAMSAVTFWKQFH
jgi:uncharacterized protein